MPGALVIQTRSSLWYRQSRLKLESEETKSLAQKKKGDELQGLTCDLKKNHKNNLSAAQVLTALLPPEAVAGLHHSCSTGRTTGLHHIEPV